MMKKNILLFAASFTILVLLGLCSWQSVRCARVKSESKNLEKVQAECIESNRRLVAVVTQYSSARRIEHIARTDLGMSKIAPENITLVKITGGKGSAP